MNPQRMPSTPAPFSSTEGNAMQNEKSRRPRFPANLRLPLIEPGALKLSPPQDGYWNFSKLKREKGKVNCMEVDNARKPWRPTTLMEDEPKRENELASIWNWGCPVIHSNNPDISSSSSNGIPSTIQSDSAAINDPATGGSSVPTPCTSSSVTNVSSVEIVTVASAAAHFKPDFLLIDYSLYADLENCLYTNRLVPKESSPLYMELHKIANRFVFLIILRMGELGDVFTDRPISHVFVDIIACVKFLRETAALDGGDQISYEEEYSKLAKQRENFWKGKLTEVDSSWKASGHWEEYWAYLQHQINLILSQTRNLLLLDPDDHFPGCFLHHTHSHKGISQQTPNLRRLSPDHPLIRRARPESFREDIFKRAGINIEEINTKIEFWSGSLSDINDRDIYTGPFRLALTDDPHLHLRFDGNKKRPTILVLDSRTVSILAILDLTDLMKQIGLPGYLTELYASQSLIFGTEKSQEIVKGIKQENKEEQQIKEINLQIIQDFRESRGAPGELWEFPILGSRLRRIYQKMFDWRPLRLRQLWNRPYRDPLSYFAAWFAVIVGVLTILALAVGVLQLVFTILTWKITPAPTASH